MKLILVSFGILIAFGSDAINAISPLATELSCNFAKNRTCGYSLLNVRQTDDGIMSVANTTSVIVKSFEANQTLCVSVRYSVEGDRSGSLMKNNVTLELMRHTTKEDRGGAFVTPPEIKPGHYVVNTSFDGLMEGHNAFTMNFQMETTTASIMLERIAVRDGFCNDTAEYEPCDCSVDENLPMTTEIPGGIELTTSAPSGNNGNNLGDPAVEYAMSEGF